MRAPTHSPRTARRRAARSVAFVGLGLFLACSPAVLRSGGDASPVELDASDAGSSLGDGSTVADVATTGGGEDAKPPDDATADTGPGADARPADAAEGDALYQDGQAVDAPTSADAPPAASPIPAKLVAGYLEAWSGVLPDAVSSKYDLLYLAFAVIDGAGNASVWVAADRATLAAQIKSRRQVGKPTILSIGGAGGAQSGLNTPAEIANFINTVVPLVDEFGCAGIDWDLESGVPGGISVSGLVSASRQLRAHYGSDFAVTMAPYGTVESTYKQVAQQLASSGDLTYVGYQFYNDVAIPDAASVKAKLAEWIAQAAIGEDQFVIGFWHGPDDWLGLITPYADMSAAWLGVEAAHPAVRGVYTWAVAGSDMPGFPFANEMDPVVH